MDHIPYIRQAIVANCTSINEIIPENLELNNFAVFCGNLSQRLDTALHSISRYIGEIGIVVMHDTNNLNYRLYTLTASKNIPGVYFRSNTQKIYDPLYGMSSNGILDLLAPTEPANPLSHDIDSLRSGIDCYLQIMEQKFSENPNPFGKYPYNLDLLLNLCEMPYKKLAQTVLNFLPKAVRDSIEPTLKAADMQTKVLACVKSFANTMKAHLWERQDFGNQTGVSIIDSVTSKGVISIRVPKQSNTEVLSYIDSELKELQLKNIPFLLVTCGIDISHHPAIQKWFLDEHEGQNYYTAIIANSLSSIIDNQTEPGKLFSQYQQIIVFKCDETSVAEPFSSQFGEYYRRETEVAVGTAREPLKVLATHQRSVAERYVTERNVRVEELIGLSRGILLFGKVYQLPYIINNFNY